MDLPDWPNFPRVDDPPLWEFRLGIYLDGCAVRGREEFASHISEQRPGAIDYDFLYAWDAPGSLRWVHQAVTFERATPDRQPWLSVFPYCSTVGDVDHLLPDCPSVQAAQRHGIRVHWGLGLLDVDGTDVCGWCVRVYSARRRRSEAAPVDL